MPGRFFTVVCAPAVFIALILCAVPVSADTGWMTKGVSENTTNALGGKISGDAVLYLGGGEGLDRSQNRIYLYEIRTGGQKIVGSPSANMTVTGPEIAGEYAVWFETPLNDFDPNKTSTAPNRVYLYSLRNDSAEILDAPGTAEWPKIDGGRVIWLNESGDSFNVLISLYDIGTGKSEGVWDLPIVDPAGVLFDGDHIAYQSTRGLFLYSLDNRANTTVFLNVFGNKSGSDVGEYAMGGDYLIYLQHSATFEGPDKGTFDEPYLYRISTGETKRFDPTTGAFSNASQPTAKAEKALEISSLFTDGERIGWVYSENSPESTIVLCDPKTGAVEKISVDGLADHVSLDGDRMTWVETHFPSFHGELIYAQEDAGTTETMPASTPGFAAGIVIAALLSALVLLAGRKK